MRTRKEIAMRTIQCWPLALLLAGVMQASAADDPCAGFKWDTSRERALFSTAGATLPAGKDGTNPPAVAPDHLYRMVLVPTAQVSFPVTPGKTSRADGTYAGVFALTLPAPGRYRVSLDGAFWIDIAGHGKLVQASDYEGQHDCAAPRKIVEFALEDKGPWLLQLSGATQAAVRVTVTPAK
jgi:hypothetical protein